MLQPYGNIPHKEGIKACRTVLNIGEVQEPPAVDFGHLLELILPKNNFNFEDKHYLQLHGMATGIRWPRRMPIYL